MIFNLSTAFTTAITTLEFTATSIVPAFAGIRYVSLNGNLTIEYGDACSTTSSSGSYHEGGVAGDLVATTCEVSGGDISEHQFMDTSGSERCHGCMTQYWGERVMTVWQVEGAVSGYSCSQTGEKFEVEMNSGEQI